MKIHRDLEKLILEEVTRQIILTRQLGVNLQISQLRFLEEDAQIGDDADNQKQNQVRQLNLIRARGLLDKALAKPLQFDD